MQVTLSHAVMHLAEVDDPYQEADLSDGDSDSDASEASTAVSGSAAQDGGRSSMDDGQIIRSRDAKMVPPPPPRARAPLGSSPSIQRSSYPCPASSASPVSPSSHNGDTLRCHAEHGNIYDVIPTLPSARVCLGSLAP